MSIREYTVTSFTLGESVVKMTNPFAKKKFVSSVIEAFAADTTLTVGAEQVQDDLTARRGGPQETSFELTILTIQRCSDSELHVEAQDSDNRWLNITASDMKAQIQVVD